MPLISKPGHLGLFALTAVAVGAIAPRLFAIHPTNAGPKDPPIKFPVPTPEPLSAADEMKTFRIAPGFKIELAAAEPIVEDPVQITFDERGRMWVVELRGYMHTTEGGGENEPTGRIKILESTKGDGNFDKSTIFLDHLLMPRTVLPCRGGALVGEPPNLSFYKEINGHAGPAQLIAANYGVKGGQPEHMANGLMYGLDNWIYSADWNGKLRFMAGKWIVVGDRPRGQWGLSQDDFGRMYFNYNEDILRCDVLPPAYSLRNPNWPGTTMDNVQIMKDQTVWPGHKTPGVNRGYEDGILRDDGSLRAVTATCGPQVYRSDLFPAEYESNVFICEPAGNLVKRTLIGPSAGSLRAQNAYYSAEFFTSTDERCRPVNLATGPDGALYIVDMYRGVIEHERFITNYLEKNIVQRKLIEPFHRGRIYRVVSETGGRAPFKMPTDPAQLVECLANPNGFIRDTAQRLLIEKHDPDATDAILKTASSSSTPLSRIHALWTLEGLNQITAPIAVAAMGDADSQVRATGIRLAEPFLVPLTKSQVLPSISKLTSDPSSTVRVQVLLSLAPVADTQADAAVMTVLETSSDVSSAVLRDSAISGLRGRELEFLETSLKRPAYAQQSAAGADWLAALSRCIFLEHRAAPVAKLIELTSQQKDSTAWRGVAMLRGMTEPVAGSLRRTPKLLYLQQKSEGLASLLSSDDSSEKKLAMLVDKTIAWPGKPGVKPPPRIVPLTASQQQQFDHGKVLFANICAACHQLSGLGQEGLAPPLLDSEWLLGAPARPIRIVLNGVSGPIKVDGVEFHLEMPALATMNDPDIADVLTYARREWEHGGDPISLDQVRDARQESKERANSWTAAELSKIK